MLAVAVAHADEDITLDQLQYRIRRGESILLIWIADDGELIIGAATVEFKEYPRQRVALVSFVGGDSGLTDQSKFDVLAQWCRERGASAIEAWCRPVAARLFEKNGFQQKYIVTRCAL
jgi:hypothetical protein